MSDLERAKSGSVSMPWEPTADQLLRMQKLQQQAFETYTPVRLSTADVGLDWLPGLWFIVNVESTHRGSGSIERATLHLKPGTGPAGEMVWR